MRFATVVRGATTMNTISHILVPTDFSACSDQAIAFARKLGCDLSAVVHLLHVMEEPFITPGSYQVHLPDTPARREARYTQARRWLGRTATALNDIGVRTTTEVRSGRPVDEILKAATDYGADMILMGTHGRSGLAHLLAGSVAEAVLRTSSCPVLTVREQPALETPAGAAA
jgi:universal stress protein A